LSRTEQLLTDLVDGESSGLLRSLNESDSLKELGGVGAVLKCLGVVAGVSLAAGLVGVVVAPAAFAAPAVAMVAAGDGGGW
jgi:hypothetical protein